MPVMLPPLDEVLAAATVVSVPMRVRFRGVTVREAVLLHGPLGWGEFAPFVEYDDAEAASWLAAGLEAGWAGWPTSRRSEVSVNATVPAIAAADVAALLDRFAGCDTVKVKVAEPGQTLADDVARVRAVRAHWPHAAIRVDANANWSLAEAATALLALADIGLQYAEQPCPTVEDLLRLRAALESHHVSVPLAADESIRKADDPLRVARSGAVDFAVVKVAPLGGVAATLAVADRLTALGVRVVVSSALDTSVGIAAGLAAAGALPDEPLACGLGTVSFFDRDVCQPPLVPVAGRLRVLATAPTPVLAPFAADPVRTAWWTDRLTRCWRVLETRTS